jgi:hypothetical protein
MGSDGFRPGRVPESAPRGSRRPWNRMAISIVPKSSLGAKFIPESAAFGRQ